MGVAGASFGDISSWGGEAAALAAALLWAIAASIFARLGDRVSPLTLNLTKGIVALGLLGATLLLLQRPFPPVEFRAVLQAKRGGLSRREPQSLGYREVRRGRARTRRQWAACVRDAS